MKQIKLLLVFVFAFGFISLNLAQDSANSTNAIQIMQSDSFYYCTLEMTGGYEQHPDAFMRMMNFCSNNNVEMMPAGIYWNSPADTKPEDLKWELAVMIPTELKVDEPFKVKKWEYDLAASANFDGIYLSEEEGKTISEVFQWVADNGYSVAGPLVRKYLNQPVQTPDGQWSGKLQIIVPVQKKQ